jgi:hypothetical protein
MKHYLLVAPDVRQSVWLFYVDEPPGTGPRVRQPYLDLACPICRKIDEVAALTRGLEAGIKLGKRMPEFFHSEDNFPIVSAGFRSFLDSCQATGIKYYDLPSDERFFVAFPEVLFRLEQHPAAFRTEGHCQTCGRPSWSGFGSDLFPVPDGLETGALMFEGGPMLVVSERIADRVAKAKIKGPELHPYFKVN